MAVRSSASPSRPMNDLMRSVADIPGDADDDLPEISPELVLVDPELARLVREDAAAAAAAAPSRDRDRALRLVRGAPRVDDRVDDPDPAEQVIVPRPAVTEGSHHVGKRERDSQVENDELIVPRAIEPTESPATAGSEPAVEAPAASQAVVAGAEPASELLPGVVPTASEPVVEVPTASQAVVAEAEPAPGLVPGAVSMVSEPVVEAPSASRAVVPTPAVVVDVGSESELVPGVVPTVSEPDGEREEAEEPSSPGTIVVPTTVSPVGEPASEITAHAIPVVARRVVDAEPARVVAPRPAVSAFPVTVPEPAEMAPEPRTRAILTPAMPHPIVRPGEPTRAPSAPRGPRRGRGAIAFLASVAVASLAVLGILNLTGGTSSSGALPPSGESGPSSSGAATGKAQGNDSTKAKAAAKARAQAAAKARAQAAAKARAQAAAKARAGRGEGQGARRGGGQGEGGEGKGGEGKGREGKGIEGCGDREGGERCQGRRHPDAGGDVPGDGRGAAIRVGPGRGGDRLPRRALQGSLARPRRGDEATHPRGRPDVALRGQTRPSLPGDVPLVRLAGHDERTGHPGRRPGEARHSVAGRRPTPSGPEETRSRDHVEERRGRWMGRWRPRRTPSRITRTLGSAPNSCSSIPSSPGGCGRGCPSASAAGPRRCPCSTSWGRPTPRP